MSIKHRIKKLEDKTTCDVAIMLIYLPTGLGDELRKKVIERVIELNPFYQNKGTLIILDGGSDNPSRDIEELARVALIGDKHD